MERKSSDKPVEHRSRINNDTVSDIVVPAEVSTFETAALAAELAKRLKATLHLFSADEVPRWAVVVGSNPTLSPSLQVQDVVARRAEAAELATTLAVPTSVEVVKGETEYELLELVGNTDLDLVVVAADEVGLFTRLFKTSLVGAISRLAKIPVLVTPKRQAPAPKHFQRIVIGVDDGSNASKAAAMAAALGTDDATLWFVHVADAGLNPTIAQVSKRVRELENVMAELSLPEHRTRAVIARGVVSNALIEEATSVEADLIVVGSRRHTEVGDRLFGTTADQILAASTQSVLTVPLETHD